MITLTERAAAKLRELLGREPNEKAALRFRVVVGGCSGLRYELAFDQPREGDTEVAQHGVPVILDDESASHLSDCILDYSDALNESGFQIDNPNAATTCGCGESFSV